LLGRLGENDFLETPSNLLPLTLRRLVQLVGVSVEALVEQAKEEQRFIFAAGGRFSEPLQQEHIMPLRMDGRKFKELAEFVNDKQQSLGFGIRDDLCIGLKNGTNDLLIAGLGLGFEQFPNGFNRAGPAPLFI